MLNGANIPSQHATSQLLNHSKLFCTPISLTASDTFKMHLILTGATGLIGSAVLQNMLAMKEVTRISILSRRPVPMAEGHEEKAKVIIHKDFNNYETALLEELKGAQGCVWALGISATQVSKPYAIPQALMQFNAL